MVFRADEYSTKYVINIATNSSRLSLIEESLSSGPDSSAEKLVKKCT
jgi:hypothetical protein